MLEQEREAFAVPGSTLDPRAEGTNSLIKQGATPVTEPDYIVSVLRLIMGTELGTELGSELPGRAEELTNRRPSRPPTSGRA